MSHAIINRMKEIEPKVYEMYQAKGLPMNEEPERGDILSSVKEAYKDKQALFERAYEIAKNRLDLRNTFFYDQGTVIFMNILRDD